MASFLDLPGELRNNIYNDILSSIFSQTASPPWQSIQSPQLFLSLLLCNKQIHDEIKSLFDKNYATNLTLYCDNEAQLFHYHDQAKAHPVLQDANFIVRDIRLHGTSAGEEHWMVRILKSQPGFRLWWLERNKLYRAKPVFRRMFEERGFEYIELEDATARLKDAGTRVGYSKLVYPSLKNGCRIMAFTWTTRTYWGYEFECGSMVLEGKLRDLYLDDGSRHQRVPILRMRGGRTE